MFLIVVGLLIIVAVASFYFLNLLKNELYLLTTLHKLPGPPGKFSISNIFDLFTSREKVFKIINKWAIDYYPILKAYFGHVMLTGIFDPIDFEAILTNMKHNRKSRVYDLLLNWLGTGLLTSDGSKWHSRRKILTPAFHFSILQQFIGIFNEETDKLIEELKKESDRPFINVTNHITQFTLQSIGETAMGTKVDYTSVVGKEYKKSVYDIADVFLHRILRPWLHNRFFYYFSPYYYKERTLVKKLHNFTNQVIKKRQETFDINKTSYSNKKRLAMLDLLLTAKEKNGNIDDEGIREEVDTFMFEGHDTTSVAICYALMLIACHKNVQENLILEMQQVLGDIKKKPTFNDLQELKYMERTIKEVLRLYPSVYFISRVLGEDMITNSGYLLPKNTIVMLFIYAMQRNPKFFPNPEIFDPDRFLPENCTNRNPFVYVPFSAGPRNCIGQRFALLEIKAVLCGILSNFILEPVDTPETIELIVDIVLRTKHGIRVKFIPR